MSVRSGQSVVVEFVTSSPLTQAAVNADSLPVGTLVVSGVDNAATVTVTNIDTGRYKASVTLPTLAFGDVVEISIAATVSAIAGKAVVWRDTKDLALTSTGAIGIDWSNVQNPTTTLALTNTTIATVTNLTNAATSGDLTAAMKASVNTEADTALSDYGALKPTTAGRTLDVSATGEAGVDWANVGSPTATVNLSGTTISTVGSTNGIGTDGLTSGSLAASAVAEIAAGVVDLATSGHTTSGTFGAAIVAAGSAGDPLATPVPGAYAAGTAGYLIGNNLDAAVNSRMATFSLPTHFSALAVTAAGGVTLADGVAHGGSPWSSTATLALQNLVVSNNSGDAVNFNSNASAALNIQGQAWGIYVGSNAGPALYLSPVGGECLKMSGDGNFPGIVIETVSTGIRVTASADYPAVHLQGGVSSHDILLSGTGTLWDGSNDKPVSVRLADATDHGGDPGSSTATLALSQLVATSQAADRPALSLIGNGIGPAVQFGDGSSGAEGLLILAGTGNTDADAVTATGAGTGVGFRSSPDAVGFGGGVTFPANFSSLAIDSAGHVLTDRVMFSGTLGDQSLGSVTTVVLPTGPATNGVLIRSRLRIYSGAGQYQERTIVGWNGSDKTAEVDAPWLGVEQAAGDLFHVLYDNAPQLDPAGFVYSRGVVDGITSGALAQFFTLDSTRVAGDAVAGSVVREISNVAGDPLATPVPGAYAAGTAGYLIGNNLDAAVGTRSTYAGGDTSGTTTLLARLTSGRAGNLDNLDAAVSSRSTLSAAQVNAECDTALADYDAPTKAELDSGLATLSSHGDTTWATATGFSTFNPATTAVTLAAGGLDAVMVESGINARQALAGCLSFAVGEWAGTFPGVVTFSAAGSPGTTRITGTLAAGSRASVVLNLPT